VKWRAALGALCLGLLLAGCGGPGKFADETAPLTASDTPPTSSEAAPSSPGADVTPTAVRIPSIGVNNNEMMQVGLNPDRSLEVPPLSEPTLIGWYRNSPLPGDSPMCTFDAGCPGSSVLLGHINGNGAQGAFAKLSKVKVGSTIEVSRSDGKVAVFTVYKVMIFQKANFPTKDIYGTTSSAELRVITCGPSDLDRAAGSYRQQTVLKAKLKELRPA
jgi:hypothetical protein